MITTVTYTSTVSQSGRSSKAISSITINTCVAVLTFPNELAEMTTPCWVPAATRSTVTANSRAMITIATHASSRPSDTRATSAAMIRSLSAIGSISFPTVVTQLRERAR